ncbi:MAG: hypothetical protein JRH00_14820 [Deltaproteobacteria bacterium]|nr:hypothetical protein [Deltaproteobacteria bacterium]MBW2112674.1 hypothetical protein [Deltaproteobacteria bacterium]
MPPYPYSLGLGYGLKDRILVIGKSMFFGSKPPRERALWSIRIEQRLGEAGYNRWEVLNAGVPGYNAVQYRTWWEDIQVAFEHDRFILDSVFRDWERLRVMLLTRNRVTLSLDYCGKGRKSLCRLPPLGE